MRNLKNKIFDITALTVLTLFMSSSVIAQAQETQQDTTTQDTTIQTSDQQQTLPQEQNQRTNQGFDSQEPDKGVDYSETVDKSELSQEINNSLDELYPAHEVAEVLKGDDESFKIKVKNENDEAYVYYDSEGIFIRAHNLSGLQQEGALPQNQSQRTQESQDQSQWGTDDRPNQQGTQQDNQQGSWESETDDMGMEQGTQKTKRTRQEAQESWGTDSDIDDAGEIQQETQQSAQRAQQEAQESWGTDSDIDDAGEIQQETQQSAQRAQQEAQESWGTDSDTDDAREETQHGTQQSAYGTQQGAMDTESSSYPQDQNQRSDDESRSQDSDKGVDYSDSIEESELPEEVTTSLEELYPAHEIEEANRGDDDSFKVKVKNQDDKAVVYYNSEGDFLRARNLNEMQGTAPQEQGQRTYDSQDQDQWGTDDNQQGTQMGTGTETRSNKQESQQDWGTDTDNKMETHKDDATRTQQGTTEAWGDTAQNKGSAYPQDQNQRTQEQTTWGIEGDRSTDSDFGSADTTQSQGEYYTAPVDTVASPQEQFQRGTGDVDYSEAIEENELPESVTSSLDELYPEHEIEKAYRGDDGSYKIKVKKDDEQTSVYYDSEGQFSRDEDKNDRMHKDDDKDTNQDW